ncbi:GntR family transcriptional regulator [Marinobacterium nitratireducens]|uniref:GntR family transcriptional regulator n=2 Tax=Marinobacterium nitratireducens TaxID=518897 RepID=A0A917Z7S9_9GAMM|nr:GntR family transcriptional regulator [Marinobacterium nitratireducens]
MDISRTSLREAIRSLEAEGLLTLVPHRGAVVASVELPDVRQIYQVRGALEALATSNFVVSSTDEEIAELANAVEELRIAASRNLSGKEIREIKQRFYDILLGISENRIVKEQLDKLNNRISMLRTLSMGRPGRLKFTVIEIEEIVEAIKKRDRARASEAALKHIENSEKNVVELLLMKSGEKQNNH